MILKRFGFRVVLRLVLILALMLVFSQILGDERLFFNQVILLLLMVALIWELIRYINRTNRDLSKFLLSVKHSDFNVNFNKKGSSQSFDELQDALTDVIQSYENLKMGEQASGQLMEHLVNQMPLGVMAIRGSDIILSNESASRILGVKEIRNLDILRQQSPTFVGHIEGHKGESSAILDNNTSGEKHSLLIDLNQIELMGEIHQLIIFRDVSQEMEEKELEAWLRLIRILTHEIMNSATPIASLTETMQSMLAKNGDLKKVEDLDNQTIKDISFSLETIHKRSEYMLNFVKDYRELTRVPVPRKSNLHIGDLIERMGRLHQSEFEKNAIEFTSSGLDWEVFADGGLLEQVFINLISNSIHALADLKDGVIKVEGEIIGKRAFIYFTDNGPGIPEKEIHDVFIPFFTTREQGSGIGLSLVKQILYSHGGSIRVESGEGTKFIISLPLE